MKNSSEHRANKLPPTKYPTDFLLSQNLFLQILMKAQDENVLSHQPFRQLLPHIAISASQHFPSP